MTLCMVPEATIAKLPIASRTGPNHPGVASSPSTQVLSAAAPSRSTTWKLCWQTSSAFQLLSATKAATLREHSTGLWDHTGSPHPTTVDQVATIDSHIVVIKPSQSRQVAACTSSYSASLFGQACVILKLYACEDEANGYAYARLVMRTTRFSPDELRIANNRNSPQSHPTHSTATTRSAISFYFPIRYPSCVHEPADR